jgi:hypothetical protein
MMVNPRTFSVNWVLARFSSTGEPVRLAKLFLNKVADHMHRTWDPKVIEGCETEVDGTGPGFAEHAYKDVRAAVKANLNETAAILVTIPPKVWSIGWTELQLEARKGGGSSEGQLKAKPMADLGLVDSVRRSSNPSLDEYSSTSKHAKGATKDPFGFSRQALRKAFADELSPGRCTSDTASRRFGIFWTRACLQKLICSLSLDTLRV